MKHICWTPFSDCFSLESSTQSLLDDVDNILLSNSTTCHRKDVSHCFSL